MEQPKPPPAKIYRSFICEKCGFDAKSHEEYRQHKIDHTSGKEFPVKGVEPIEPIKPIPSEVKAEAPWNKGAKSILPATPNLIQPITLKYLFTGTCPTCNSEVETIPLDVDVNKQKQFVIVCWCSTCKKNIQQRMVTKL